VRETSDDNVVQGKSRWILNDVVFVVDGKGYGVTGKGTTFCIGPESDILAWIKGEEVDGIIAGNLIRAGCTRQSRDNQGTTETVKGRGLAFSKSKQKRQTLSHRRSERFSSRSKNDSRSAA
jgi:hypothetical protein